MKVVLDTNVLLVAIGKRSPFKPIWKHFIEGSFQVIVSEDILHEYEEIIRNHGAPGAAELVMDILEISADVIYKRIYFAWQAIPNAPDDNKFFDAAIAGGADYLVTNDAHFKEAALREFPNVKIISAEQFLSVLEKL